MSLGNKLLLVIAVIQIQSFTLFASQALCKSSEDLCEAFRSHLSINTADTARECTEIGEIIEEPSEQELINKVCGESLSKNEGEQDASDAVSCKPKNLGLIIETTSDECTAPVDDFDSSQNCQLEQELQNKVHEEVVSKSSADQTDACLSKECSAVVQSAVQKDVQGNVVEKLAFSDADVRGYLDERSIAYAAQHQVRIQNGKAACALAACQTLALQKNEKGMGFFIPCKITAPILITNPGITQVKVIRASAGKRWIEVYLGYNPQLQTTVGSDKIYEASILLLQKSLPSPLSKKVVQSQPPAARSIGKPNKQ